MENLYLNRGSRSIVLGLEEMQKRSAQFTVDEIWEDRDDEGYCDNEYNNATYYLTVDEIDAVILKLNDIKTKILENANLFSQQM